MYPNFVTKKLHWCGISGSESVICNVIWENLSNGAKYQIWFIGIWKFELSSFQNLSLGPSAILVPKVTDVQRLWKIKKNIRVMVLNSFILQFHSVRHVTGFVRSHHIYFLHNHRHVTHSAWSGGICHNYLLIDVIKRRCPFKRQSLWTKCSTYLIIWESYDMCEMYLSFTAQLHARLYPGWTNLELGICFLSTKWEQIIFFLLAQNIFLADTTKWEESRQEKISKEHNFVTFLSLCGPP